MVALVQDERHVAQVAKSVVAAPAVDVIYRVGPVAVNDGPDDTVREDRAVKNLDDDVTMSVGPACSLPSVEAYSSVTTTCRFSASRTDRRFRDRI